MAIIGFEAAASSPCISTTTRAKSRLWNKQAGSSREQFVGGTQPYDFPKFRQDLIPFLTADEGTQTRGSKLISARSHGEHDSFEDPILNGLTGTFCQTLRARSTVQADGLFTSTGGTVSNTDYGMYIGLEEKDLERRRAVIRKISRILLPKVSEHFRDCKPHLGSFLVKAPGQDSYTYPHQDWTFVDAPPYVSITVWIALVDTDESNGALGFVKGSHTFFDRPIGSPSPEFQTCTQGHEGLLYEYLDFVPLKAGEAVAFDNRTIHGATPNRTTAMRTAVAIGMTPKEARLFHYFLVPGSLQGGLRTVAKLSVDDRFFEHYSVTDLQAFYAHSQLPENCAVETTLVEDFIPFSADEIRHLCEQSGLTKNGKHLVRSAGAGVATADNQPSRIRCGASVEGHCRPRIMKPLLKDPSLQADFERDGFVVVRLFTSEQTSLLLDLYRRYIQEDKVSGLYESSRHNNYQVNRSINEAVREQVALAGQDLFLPSKIYGGSFMVKSHAESEVLPLHQDWSVLEEQKYSTLFVWCPLMDVSVVNGCLFVLPGSHVYFQSLRSGSYPSDRFILPPDLHRHTQDIPLRAGEAVLYSDQVFHGSYANNGSGDRVVVTARVMEQEADLVYFHKANDREVDVCRADEEFYLTHIDSLAKGKLPPTVSKLYRRLYTHVPVTDATLQAHIRTNFQVTGGSSDMRNLFKDARLQAVFDRDGYAVIDLIDQAQVQELRAFYDGLEHAGASANGFQVSLDNESSDFVRAVSERLVNTARGSVEQHFQHHKIFTASFVTKGKHPLGIVPPHQDWTFVDESRFWSATIWCPLMDVNVDNGALGVIKGSHRLYDHVRPSPSPQYTPPFKDQLFTIFPYLTILELKAV